MLLGLPNTDLRYVYMCMINNYRTTGTVVPLSTRFCFDILHYYDSELTVNSSVQLLYTVVLYTHSVPTYLRYDFKERLEQVTVCQQCFQLNTTCMNDF